MTHAQNADMVVSDAVTDDVGVGESDLAKRRARNEATTMRKVLQSVAGGQYLLDEVLGGARMNCAM
jgi:hypothetical protein